MWVLYPTLMVGGTAVKCGTKEYMKMILAYYKCSQVDSNGNGSCHFEKVSNQVGTR